MKIDLSRIRGDELERVRRAASGRAGWGWWLRALDFETARRRGQFPPEPIEVETPPGPLAGWLAAAAELRDGFRDAGKADIEALFADLVAELLRAQHGRQTDDRRLHALCDLGIDPDDVEWTAA